MNSEQQIQPGLIIHGVEQNVVEMTMLEKYFIQFLHMLIQCLLCRPVIMNWFHTTLYNYATPLLSLSHKAA